MEELFKWLEEITVSEPRPIIYGTGKQGAILAYMYLYREFANPTEEEEIAYREKLEKELPDGFYTIGGENFIEHPK